MNLIEHTAQISRDPIPSLQRIQVSAEECVEGEANDVESEEVTEYEEHLCSCDTTSEENLIKGISKKLSNIKRMILRNDIA